MTSCIKKKKNIIFITSCMGKGGTQRVISNLAHYFINDYNVSIVTLFSSEVSYDIDKRIKVLDFSCNDRKRVFQIPVLISQIRKLLKSLDKNDTTVLSFLTKVNLLILVSKFNMSIPVIISERNDPKHDGRNIIIRLLCKHIYPYADKIIFQTEYAKSCFSKKIQKNSIVIQNPVIVNNVEELDCIQDTSKEDLIVSVGRLISQKNQKLLIEAFSEISSEFKNIKLIIYGEGNLREELKQIIENLNLSDRVFLPGVVDDVHNKIKNSRCFVLTSNYEGQSNAILEAMSLGIACISTNCSGISEVINGENGILIDVGDKKSLVREMREILKNSEYAKGLGEKAKLSINEFTLENIAKKWESAFND